MANPTVAAGYTRALLAYAVSRGADRRTLLQRSGLSPDQLEEQEDRVPLAGYLALMGAAAQLCADPALALHFGEVVRAEDMSVAWLIAAAAPTVGEGRVQMNRYARLVLDDDGAGAADLLELVRDAAGPWLAFRSPVHVGDPWLAEAGFARAVTGARAMLQSIGWDRPFPRALHFTHAEPGYRAEYDRIFGVPLVFGSDRNAMLVDEAFLAIRLPPSNGYVFRVLSERADALLQSLERSRTIRGRVEAALMPILHTGEAGMDRIAAGLGLSRQTLYRRLKTEGASFEQVLDALRYRLALDYLGGRKVSVNQTAYLVGFSDPAAFSRAFKRWTGAAPGSFTRFR